jgi:hypothetical protein
MLVRGNRSVAFGRAGSARRRGTVTMFLIAASPVLLLAFVLAVQVSSLRHRQVELQIAADAAALAGANALVDDLLLTDRLDRRKVVLQRSRDMARTYGRHNHIMGEPLVLDEPVSNAADEELVHGHLDAPRSRIFDNDLDNPLLDINAVRVTARRQSVAAKATAYVDRDVVGFKPQGRRPLPVVPLALLTDPTEVDKRSWDYQILARKGTFDWFIDPRTGRPRKKDAENPADDDIPEMTAVLSVKGNDDNARLAVVGTESVADAARQVRTGMTRQDLAGRGGQLLLEDRPGMVNQMVLPRFRQLSPDDLGHLAVALEDLVISGERRVWLLYSGVDADLAEVSGCTHGSLRVPGFVVARVMQVERQGSGSSLKQVKVVLQPSMKITDTAETDVARRTKGPRTIYNPYISKVRLMD